MAVQKVKSNGRGGNKLEGLICKNGSYKTTFRDISLLSKILPSGSFYCRLLRIIFKASHMAKQSRYNNAEWSKSSLAVLYAIERAGIKIEINGVDNFISLKQPCIFIANHMSTLETFVLPAIILPFKSVTFVVKRGLIDYPVFRHIMRSRDPIVVNHKTPREDLKAVLEGGTERLKAGVSIIIFPQATRTTNIEPSNFSTIGIKLAKKANVPVIPIALKTDAWGVSKYLLKDFGKINPSKEAHFAFGKPLWINNRGAEEQGVIIDFISSKLKEWDK